MRLFCLFAFDAASWDEWVPETRLLKLTEENATRQKALHDAQLAKDRAERDAEKAKERQKREDGGGTTTAGPRQSTSGAIASRGTKRGRDSLAGPADPDDDYLKRPSIKLPIPDELKVRLVDEWEAITKNQQQVPLPRAPSVQQILRDYETHVNKSKGDRVSSRSGKLNEEFVAGLQTYFNKCLGLNLLYRFERLQYHEQIKKRAWVPLAPI